uniref:Probable protein-export membrane protein SecG n=1 Tax=Pseudochlorella signiensis TaxID=173497 RepID=A0A097KL18_9CHLO|nr:hypothetical chloroplast RF47 [Pseudochlorella signiensis]AIT93871.1 hypothetical chloroplast RF47 [Pseudochlorella signiensis]
MLNIIQLTFAILVIVLIVPQTPTENALLRIFYETRVFPNSNYGQTKKFLNLLTWVCIFIFLILTFTNVFS